MTKEHALKYIAMLSRYHNAGWGAILNDRPPYKQNSAAEENQKSCINGMVVAAVCYLVGQIVAKNK